MIAESKTSEDVKKREISLHTCSDVGDVVVEFLLLCSQLSAAISLIRMKYVLASNIPHVSKKNFGRVMHVQRFRKRLFLVQLGVVHAPGYWATKEERHPSDCHMHFELKADSTMLTRVVAVNFSGNGVVIVRNYVAIRLQVHTTTT
eukprot:PhM_4_TR16826/c2_g7_i8/m.47919